MSEQDYQSNEKGLAGLQVWQRSVTFAVDVCQRILPLFPVEEKWALSAQLRRAAQSIPANIGEGYGRFYYQEGIRFCYIARGSLEESFTQITLAHKLKYLPNEVYREKMSQINELRRLLNGYVVFLKRTKHGLNDPGAPSSYHLREPLTEYVEDETNDGEVPILPYPQNLES